MALIDTLGTGVSALQSFTTGLDTVANNIANIDTTGFKGADTSFSDTFSGAGVQVASTTTNFDQGALTSTGVPTNLGISGNGYFMVSDPTGTQFATRDGTFSFDKSGNLINQQGYNVLGIDGKPIAVAQTDALIPASPGTGTLESVSISTSGAITAAYSDGYSAAVATVGLQNFTDPSQLTNMGNNLYSNLTAATPTITSGLGTPGVSGLGTTQSGSIEQSNVDLTQEFANMITMQRAFEANSRLVTVSDTILQDIINLKQP
jgi:flagellar hook protein FlgE